MQAISRPERQSRKTIVFALCLSALLIFIYYACSDNGNPTAPTNHLPDDEGLPSVPVLTSPDAELPARSETRSIAKPAFDFAPRISRALADWYVRGYGIYEEWPTWIDCSGDWRDLCGGDGGGTTVEGWNHELPSAHGCFDACGLVRPFCPDSWDVKFDEFPNEARIVFWSDGVADPTPNPVKWTTNSPSICKDYDPIFGCVSKVIIRSEYTVTGKAIEKKPYIRRDRFWVPKTWESGSIVYQMSGDNEVWQKSQYTTGSSLTQTESFAWSLGASVGAEYKGLKAQIEGSITKTFEESITVSEEMTVSVDKHLKGDAGKVTCHVLWVLVERFTFVDKNGDRFSDLNYVFHAGFPDGVVQDLYYDFEMQGTREHLAKYVFDE